MITNTPFRGAYIGKHSKTKEIILFFYIKLSEKSLRDALPLTKIKKNDEYFVSIFYNKIDYLNSSTSENINDQVKKLNLLPLSCGFFELNKKYSNLTVEKFQELDSMVKNNLIPSFDGRIKKIY